MSIKTEAGKWLADQKAKPFGRESVWSEARGRTPIGRHTARKLKHGPTTKEFIEANRLAKTAECIFVPGAIKGRPARVNFCDKVIAAARYMGLLTLGAPKHADAVIRHKCGNGHLSCVNPSHLEWGSQSDNVADANRHRGCDSAQDRISASSGRK